MERPETFWRSWRFWTSFLTSFKQSKKNCSSSFLLAIPLLIWERKSLLDFLSNSSWCLVIYSYYSSLSIFKRMKLFSRKICFASSGSGASGLLPLAISLIYCVINLYSLTASDSSIYMRSFWILTTLSWDYLISSPISGAILAFKLSICRAFEFIFSSWSCNW